MPRPKLFAFGRGAKKQTLATEPINDKRLTTRAKRVRVTRKNQGGRHR